MERPRGGLDDDLEWQKRLENWWESGLSIEAFCLQEWVSRSTFHAGPSKFRDGIPESLKAEHAEREKPETGEAVFLPIWPSAHLLDFFLKQEPKASCAASADTDKFFGTPFFVLFRFRRFSNL